MKKKYLYALSLLLAYGIVLLIVNIFHNRIFNVNVVFYSALLDVVIALFGLFLIVKFINLQSFYATFELVLIFIVCILSGYIYAISVPTLIDRSLSFYLLEKIDQQGKKINIESIANLISQDYLREHRLVDVRLTEQLESGTIRIQDGCVYLTDKGELMIKFSGFVRQNILPSKRLLMDKYSNDLKDPIGKGNANPDRECN